MTRQCGPRLEWALFDGALHHVGEFWHLAVEAERPRGECPACGQDVAMRLGAIKMHHFYHLSGQECPGTTGESLLHLNTKCWLCARLLGGSKLAIQARCSSRYRRPRTKPCEESNLSDWLAQWTDVRIEQRVGSVVPDLVLYQGDAPLGLVEVCVANRVDEGKRRRLDHQGIPWVEVDARSLYRPDDGSFKWALPDPLPVLASGPEHRFSCTPCHSLECYYLDAMARVAERAGKSAERFGRFSYSAPCGGEALSEAFSSERWAHLASGDLSPHHVSRWIRGARWECPGDGLGREWVTWSGIDSWSTDPARVGPVARLGLCRAGEVVGLMYLAPPRTPQYELAHEDALQRGLPWVLVPIEIREGSRSLKPARDNQAPVLLRMALRPHFSNVLDASERRPCHQCSERLHAFIQDMERKPRDHERVHRIRSFQISGGRGLERIGWLMVLVQRRSGVDCATSLMVREGHTTCDGGMAWSESTLWRDHRGPGRQQATAIRDAARRWEQGEAGKGATPQLGEWEDYRLQDFHFRRPRVAW